MDELDKGTRGIYALFSSVVAESSKWVAVIDAPENCNYTLIQSRERNLFKTPYTACDVKILVIPFLAKWALLYFY